MPVVVNVITFPADQCPGSPKISVSSIVLISCFALIAAAAGLGHTLCLSNEFGMIFEFKFIAKECDKQIPVSFGKHEFLKCILGIWFI